MSIISTLRSLWGRIFGGGTRPTPAPPKSMLDNVPSSDQTYGWVRTGSTAINKVKYEPLPGRPNFGNMIIVFANYPKQYKYYDVPISVYQDTITYSWSTMHRIVKQYSIKGRS